VPAATYYIEGLSCQAMLALPGGTLHPMFSRCRPTEPNSVGFGHSQQCNFARRDAQSVARRNSQRPCDGLVDGCLGQNRGASTASSQHRSDNYARKLTAIWNLMPLLKFYAVFEI